MFNPDWWRYKTYSFRRKLIKTSPHSPNSITMNQQDKNTTWLPKILITLFRNLLILLLVEAKWNSGAIICTSKNHVTKTEFRCNFFSNFNLILLIDRVVHILRQHLFDYTRTWRTHRQLTFQRTWYVNGTDSQTFELYMGLLLFLLTVSCCYTL